MRRYDIARNDADLVIGVAQSIVRHMSQILRKVGEEPRRFGYLTIQRRRDGRVLLVAQIGECPDNKAEKYMTLSLEKGGRLYWCRSCGFKNHLSSWQSRNEKRMKYGGAICAGPFILSFSGLPELADEAVMLRLAVELNLISLRTAYRIAKISDNNYARQLL
jgi:hypothetical protein